MCTIRNGVSDNVPGALLRRQNNKKTTIPPWKLKSYTKSLDPPPPPSGGRAGVAKMAQVPEGEIFSTFTTTFRVRKPNVLIFVLSHSKRDLYRREAKERLCCLGDIYLNAAL